MDVIGQNGNDGKHYEKEEIESYAELGYMKVEQPSPPSLTFSQEAEELNKIMGKDLTQEQMQKLKDSKLTRTFNDENDDLKIHY